MFCFTNSISFLVVLTYCYHYFRFLFFLILLSLMILLFYYYYYCYYYCCCCYYYYYYYILFLLQSSLLLLSVLSILFILFYFILVLIVHITMPFVCVLHVMCMCPLVICLPLFLLVIYRLYSLCLYMPRIIFLLPLSVISSLP